MTEGSPIRHIVFFAVPFLIGTIFQQFYNLVDTMVAGYSLGDSAIAAIGATSSLYALLISFANGLNNGYAIILSQLFGAKNWDRFRKAVAVMLVLDLAITLVLTAAVLALLRPILLWLNTPAEIFQQAYSYISIVLGGMLATIVYNMCASFLRAIGNSRTPLYFLVLSCAINVALDLFFILGLGTGVGGAAVATVIAQGISGLLCGAYIWKNYQELLPGRGDFRLEGPLVGEMLQNGCSVAMMLSVVSIGSIILQRSVNQLGTDVITAHTASRRLMEILNIPISSISTAAATFVGQNYGASKHDRIRTALRQAIWMEAGWAVLSLTIIMGGGRLLVMLLTGTSDEKIISYAMLNLRTSALFFFPLGVLIVLRNAMQAMGHKIAPVFSSAIELGTKALFCAVLIPVKGYWGVVITEPVIWVACAVFLSAIYLVERRQDSGAAGGVRRFKKMYS